MVGNWGVDCGCLALLSRLQRARVLWRGRRGGAGHLRASKAVPVGPAGVGSAVPAGALAGGPGGSKSIRRWRHVGHQMVGFGMEQFHGHCLCLFFSMVIVYVVSGQALVFFLDQEWSGTSL